MAPAIQLRHDSAAAWTASDPVLAAGEPGLESDTGRIKYGDGTTAWHALGYFLGNVDDTADVNKPVSTAQAALVSQAINDHKADPGAHSQYVSYAVYAASIANLQAQIDALTAGGSAPASITLPAVTGNAVVGSTLIVSDGTWTNNPTGYAYQWRFGASNIPGATTNTYVATGVGIVTCVVTATNGSGAASAISSSVTITAAPAAPSNTVLPVITGSPVVGNVVTCSTGTWVNSPVSFTYQWLRNGVAIVGATGSTYQTVAADVGPISCTVTAANAAGSSLITSLSVTIVIAQTSSPSNPVTTAATGIRTFDVGPGQTYAEPDTVPWGSLVAGDVVNIYHRPAPYAWKIGLRGQGTQANPIVVNGVTDANGNRPVFQFAGARTASGSNPGGADNVFGAIPAYNESLGGIVVKRGVNDDYFTYKPQWIEIRNLELRGASNDATYTTLAGGPATYSSAGGIYIHVGRDILIENCVSTDNGFGVFLMAKDETLSQAAERVTVRSCRVYGNGVVNSYLEHNFYVQCANPVIEGNFIGQTRMGSLGSSYKSRSSGEIFRYNYVEASARACDWVYSEEQSSGIAAQPDYGTDYAYGNVIVNDSSLPNGGTYAPIHYGGDNQGEQDPGQPVFSPTQAYRTHLYFFNNTVVNRDVAAEEYRVVVFDISLVAGTIDAWNNVFFCNGSPNYSWVEYAGTLNLRGRNLAFGAIGDARSEATAGQYAVNQLGLLLTTDPQLTSAATYDYTVQGGSPAIDMSAAPAGIPAGVLAAHPILYQPRTRTNGLTPRSMLGSALELGAMEFDPAAGGGNPPASAVAPAITGNPYVGQALACSVGTWSGSPTSYGYQWVRAGVNIGGAANPTYLLVNADIGDVTCVVTATNASGSTPQVSNTVTVTAAVTPPVNTLLPAIGGTFAVGQQVTASTGLWTGAPASYAYQWSRDGSAIGGATSSDYVLVQADESTDIAVTVTATNAGGSTAATSDPSHIPGALADPDANGVFNFSAANGTTLVALSDKFVPPNFADDFECQSGALQCVAGTGFYGAVVHYENGQGAAQQSTLVRVGASFPNGGELGVYVQTNGAQGGYSAWFSNTSVQLRRHSAADVGPVYIDQTVHSIVWTADATLRIEVTNGVVKVLANGVETLSYVDATPLTGGFPGLYLVPGVNVAAHAVTTWTDQ